MPCNQYCFLSYRLREPFQIVVSTRLRFHYNSRCENPEYNERSFIDDIKRIGFHQTLRQETDFGAGQVIVTVVLASRSCEQQYRHCENDMLAFHSCIRNKVTIDNFGSHCRDGPVPTAEWAAGSCVC